MSARPHTRRFWIALTLAVTTAFALPIAVRSDGPTVVNVIVLPSDTAAQVYYAQELGLFKAAGLDVRITAMSAAPPIISAVASGAADVGFATISSASLARSRGLPIRVVAPAALWISARPTAQLVVAADSPLQKASDFSGKTIAVTGLADLTYYGARAWLDANGVDSNGIKFAELSFPEMLPALKTHRVDGAVIAEPFLRMSQTGGRAVAAVNDAIAPRFISTAWVASEPWLRAHPAAATALVRVLREAGAWGNAHHRESAAILLQYTKLTPEIATTMSRVEYATDLSAALLAPSMDVAAKYSKAPAQVAPADLLWKE